MAKTKIEYFKLYVKNIIVAFDEFFLNPNLEPYDEFFLSIVSKKTYNKIADLIVKENNAILNKDQTVAEEFIYKYLTIKMAIDNDEYLKRKPESFIYDLISQLFTPNFVQLIVNYVDSKYQLNIDDLVDLEKHRFDPGTTFLDRHYKILYQVSCMSRLIIPLITHYIHNFPEITIDGEKHTLNTNQFLMDVFSGLFNCVQQGSYIDIYQKLHVYVQRAVQKTLYTDAVMWDRLMILGVTPEIAIEDTMGKIITNVLPKFSFDRNILNLTTVVIRKSIMSYTLRKKDPYTLYSLSDSDGSATDDDSVVAETEIFDSYNVQRDEAIILFRKYGTPHDVEILRQREGITIPPEEMEFYSQGRRYHEFQKSAICYAFSKYFGGTMNIISGCRREDWVRLIIMLKKSLERLGLQYLSDFLSAERESYSYKRISKITENYIEDNEKYKEIVDKKYKSTKGIFEKKNFIKYMITAIINNTYIYYSYGNPKNGQYIEKDEFQIVDQVIQFFYSFID